jgi:hypothetical protein
MIKKVREEEKNINKKWGDFGKPQAHPGSGLAFLD